MEHNLRRKPVGLCWRGSPKNRSGSCARPTIAFHMCVVAPRVSHLGPGNGATGALHAPRFTLRLSIVPGRAFDPIAWSGYKYFLACAFSVPSAAPLDSDVAMPAPEEEPFESECLEPVQAADVLSSRDGGPEDGVSDDGAGVALHLDKVTTRVRGKRPEDPDPLKPLMRNHLCLRLPNLLVLVPCVFGNAFKVQTC